MAEATTEKMPNKKVWGGGVSPFNVSWGKMYMWFFLVSDAFTFSSLILSYGVMRHRFTDIWPKANDVFTHFPFIEGHVPLAYVGLMTFILIMSSVTMVLAVDAGHQMNKKGVKLWLGLTIIGGLMFLGSQAWEWYHFIHGSKDGSYYLADGRFARTDDLHPGQLTIYGGEQKKEIVEGAAAQALIATHTKHITGANLKENEYGTTPLFGDFFFFITGFHGFHVFSGVVINVIVLIVVSRGVLERKK